LTAKRVKDKIDQEVGNRPDAPIKKI